MSALRGVNLGGWLVLERWMTPSLFSGTSAMDEMTLSNDQQARIKRHHETFITEEDFAWIADQGLKAVRIPIGYWLFGDKPPFVGAAAQIDFAFAMAQKYNLKVVISLHGAPRSQNGKRHSGREDMVGWHLNREAKQKTLAFIEKLAEKYGKHAQLWGIEVLNEPALGILKNLVLKKYYKDAYKIIRSLGGNEVKIIISDSYQPNKWIKFMEHPRYKNVVMDTHLYQCYSQADKRADINWHLQKAAGRKKQIEKWQRHKPVMVGEWGLGMGPHTFDDFDEAKILELRRHFAANQIESYDTAAAWFFWSYKTEHNNNWNLRYLVESNIINLSDSDIIT